MIIPPPPPPPCIGHIWFAPGSSSPCLYHALVAVVFWPLAQLAVHSPLRHSVRWETVHGLADGPLCDTLYRTEIL